MKYGWRDNLDLIMKGCGCQKVWTLSNGETLKVFEQESDIAFRKKTGSCVEDGLKWGKIGEKKTRL